jgi:hypothetical protein
MRPPAMRKGPGKKAKNVPPPPTPCSQTASDHSYIESDEQTQDHKHEYEHREYIDYASEPAPCEHHRDGAYVRVENASENQPFAYRQPQLQPEPQARAQSAYVQDWPPLPHVPAATPTSQYVSTGYKTEPRGYTAQPSQQAPAQQYYRYVVEQPQPEANNEPSYTIRNPSFKMLFHARMCGYLGRIPLDRPPRITLSLTDLLGNLNIRLTELESQVDAQQDLDDETRRQPPRPCTRHRRESQHPLARGWNEEQFM